MVIIAANRLPFILISNKSDLYASDFQDIPDFAKNSHFRLSAKEVSVQKNYFFSLFNAKFFKRQLILHKNIQHNYNYMYFQNQIFMET